MKLLTIFPATALLLLAGGQLQAQSKVKIKKEDQQMEYRNDNGKRSLTIITQENGKPKRVTYTGDEADAKLEELNASHEKHSGGMKIFIDDDKDGNFSMGNGSIHVTDEDGDVNVTHADGKIIIKKLDKNGKEDVEEIDLGESISKAMEEMNFKMDSTSFSFDFKDFDSEKFEKQMEKFGSDMEEAMKNRKVYISKDFDFNHGTKNQTIVKEDQETLTPEEIRAKYGVEVTGDGNEQVVIKKVIKVKGAKATETSTSETLKAGDLKIYPNPGNGDFNLNYNASKGGTTYLTLTDIKGSIVYQAEYNSKGIIDKKLDLKHLPTGVYNLSLRNGESKKVEKIVIQ